jgi:glycosyltransferase involved in cell wall biosynthesis
MNGSFGSCYGSGSSSMGDLSVVLTVYNRSDLLRRALLSLASQSCSPAEIIVSDDGSEEDVLGVVRRCLPMLACAVSYVRQPDRGFRLAKCRNNAVRLSSGSTLVFMDQDIIGTKGYLATFERTVAPRLFAVAYPARLSEAQTRRLSDEVIQRGRLDRLLTRRQRNRIRRQFAKDLVYYHARRWRLLGANRPKLRGGAFGVRREDILGVDGFDENYEAWGSEDDDLGRRLYASGTRGRNAFLKDYHLHLFHAPHHDQGRRLNVAYTRRRMVQIRAGDVRAVSGLSNPRGTDIPEVVHLQ